MLIPQTNLLDKYQSSEMGFDKIHLVEDDITFEINKIIRIDFIKELTCFYLDDGRFFSTKKHYFISNNFKGNK